MKLRFGSAASGIEAASVAWKPLGFEPAWYAEIDPFCCSLLKERHGTTPNLGDMNAITTHALRKCGRIDVLVAGTPCQAFSVAGQRKGLSDPRGQLALRLLDILDWTQTRWLVWENVPGVLSSGKGFDFAAFQWSLAQRGYGFAWRVFDAQFSGVPQRRRRVFLVGHLGDWRSAAEILFEPQSVSGDLAAGRETKQDTAGTITAGSGRRRGAGVNPSEIVCALTNSPYADNASQESKLVPVYAIQERAVSENTDNGPQGCGYREGKAYTLEARHHVQAVAYRTTGNCGALETGDKIDTLTTGTDPASHVVCGTLNASMGKGKNGQDISALSPVVDNTLNCMSGIQQPDVMNYVVQNTAFTLTSRDGNGANSNANPGNFISTLTGVRRLTPRECERLMAFPDDYTLITHRGKPAADGPRYKAIGNSINVLDLRWIGQRIMEAASRQGDH